jgi:hypothetical protein
MSKKQETGLILALSAVTQEEDQKKKWRRDAADELYVSAKMVLNASSNREANIAVAALKHAIKLADTGTKES